MGVPTVDPFDILRPLVNWVEKRIAPESVIATARGAGNTRGVNTELPVDWSAGRTRALCPSPKIAKYGGSGDKELAANFSCQWSPIVQISRSNCGRSCAKSHSQGDSP